MTDEEKLKLALAVAKAKAQQQARDPNTNPGVDPAAPPEMFVNPQTGQYTSRELLTNHMMQNQTAPTTALGATVMGAGHGATLGASDEIAGFLNAAVPGKGTIAERNTYGREMARAMQDAGQKSNPDDMLTSEIAGALSLPVGALWQGGKMLPAMAGNALTGAGFGGAYGFLSGEGEERVDDARRGALLGAGVGAATSLAGGAIKKAADNRAGRKAIRNAARGAPTSEELRAIGRQLYDQVDDAGVEVKADVFDRTRRGIVDALRGETAYSPRPGGRTITPKTAAVVDDMAQMSDEMVGKANPGLPFKEIDSLRRQAGAAAGNFADRSDQQAGMKVIEGLDDMVRGLGPDDVTAGDVKALQTALPKAREAWSKMLKSQRIDDAIAFGEDAYLSGGGTGIKYQFKQILKNPKSRAAFSEAEIAAMRRVVKGTTPEQMLRLAGSGLTHIFGPMAGFAGAGGGPLGAAAGLGVLGLSHAARAGSDAIIRRNAEIARALVANGNLNKLPVASDKVQRIIEALGRRAGPVAMQ